MSVSVDVSELTAFQKVLVRAGADIQRAADEKALTVAARELKDRAQASAPVFTGELKRSIRITAGKGWRRVGSKTRQGFFQEFGTSVMSPQPWLFANGDRAGFKVEQVLTKESVRLIIGSSQ